MSQFRHEVGGGNVEEVRGRERQENRRDPSGPPSDEQDNERANRSRRTCQKTQNDCPHDWNTLVDQNTHITNVVRNLVKHHSDRGKYTEMGSNRISSSDGHAVDEAVNSRSKQEIGHYWPVSSR